MNAFYQIIPFNNDLIRYMQQICATNNYHRPSVLFYENQIPITGYYLFEGIIEVLNNDSTETILYPGTFLGVNQYLAKNTLPFQAKISTNSKVFLLDNELLAKIKSKNFSPLLDQYIKI